MKKLAPFAVALLATVAAPAAAANERVRLETELGTIVVELDLRSPETVGNFLRYVDGGFYDGGRFHRTVTTAPDNQPDKSIKIDVIQAGADAAREKEQFKPIKLERTSVTGLRHRDGVISMARDGPDSATSDFFICVGDQPELDFGGRRNPDGQGFAAFGRVVEGMEVVRKIHQAPAQGQVLTPAIRILSARRVARGFLGRASSSGAAPTLRQHGGMFRPSSGGTIGAGCTRKATGTAAGSIPSACVGRVWAS